jgi:hypothetical protein
VDVYWIIGIAVQWNMGTGINGAVWREITLTLWDVLIEDKIRLLPATERITHTILAINAPQQMAQQAL